MKSEKELIKENKDLESELATNRMYMLCMCIAFLVVLVVVYVGGFC